MLEELSDDALADLLDAEDADDPTSSDAVELRWAGADSAEETEEARRGREDDEASSDMTDAALEGVLDSGETGDADEVSRIATARRAGITGAFSGAAARSDVTDDDDGRSFDALNAIPLSKKCAP